MILFTYQNSSAVQADWEPAALKKAGLTLIDLDDLLEKEELEKDIVYLCALPDQEQDLTYVSRHIVEHPRVLFYVNTPAGMDYCRRRGLPYVLVTPKASDETQWKLACGYDELTEEQRRVWRFEWNLYTHDLMLDRAQSAVVLLKTEKTTLSECAPLIIGYM